MSRSPCVRFQDSRESGVVLSPFPALPWPMIATIADLAAALRGLPRAADIVLRLPDGSSGRIVRVEGHNTGLAGSGSSQEPGGYRVIFAVEAEA